VSILQIVEWTILYCKHKSKRVRERLIRRSKRYCCQCSLERDETTEAIGKFRTATAVACTLTVPARQHKLIL